MFDNIGVKIKNVAKIACWIGIVVSIIIAIVLFACASDSLSEELNVLLGFVVLLAGPFLSWLCTLVLYGFGELVDNSSILAAKAKSKRDKNIIIRQARENEQKQKFIQARIHDDRIPIDSLVDIPCPNCNSEISFTRRQLLQSRDLICPFCGDQISINEQ